VQSIEESIARNNQIEETNKEMIRRQTNITNKEVDQPKQKTFANQNFYYTCASVLLIAS
jgi:hypothetical protein